MIPGACSQTHSPTHPPWLGEVVQDLIQNQELVRIKKLLIYTCTQTWESNSEKIHATDLEELLRMLLKIAPTVEKLQLVLYCVVTTLNKPAEYTLIADAIITPIESRYATAVPAPETGSESINDPATSYQTIADRLHQDSEIFRIQKLLLLVCKNVWTNNQHQLAQCDLAALVEELYKLAPSVENLNFILEQQVKKLNKRAVYTLISNKIAQALEPLYQINQAPVSSSNSALESMQLNVQTLDQLGAQVEKNQAEKNQIEASSALHGRSNSALPGISSSSNLIDRFKLRSEIICHTNPFRTKILLFSLLHELFNQTAEHYLMLKNYALDDLLCQLIQTYKSFEELNTNLLQVAKQLDESEEYSRVAQVVLRASKVYYKTYYDQRSIAPVLPTICESITNTIQTLQSSDRLTEPEPP
jgi:hypothetical protein